MPFQLRHVEDLAEDLGGKAKAQRVLAASGVRIVNGYYDHGAIEALNAEPKATNIGKKTRNAWTLAETDGIGAIKHCLDKAGLDLVRHLYHSTNYVTVRNKRGQRRQLKVYSASRTRTQYQIARYSITGFLPSTAPAHYMFICYEGPIAWVIDRRKLMSVHAQCKKNGGYLPDGFGFNIPKSKLTHKTGVLCLSLEAADEEFLFVRASQVGL